MHTILFSIKNGFILLILNAITILINIFVIISQSRLSIAQASFSFKCLNKRTFTYATPTFITEALCLVTRVQLLLTTAPVN